MIRIQPPRNIVAGSVCAHTYISIRDEKENSYVGFWYLLPSPLYIGVPDVEPVGYLRQLLRHVPVAEAEVVAWPDPDKLVVGHRYPSLDYRSGRIVPLVLRGVNMLA